MTADRSPWSVDAGGDAVSDPLLLEQVAARAEADGFDGVMVTETRHDPFVGLTLAARATSRIAVRSAIAVAFARSPMTVAVQANDLQLISAGRFHLGLGTQVRQHIERRFGMPWSQPARRMREYVAAVRAIWSSWDTGEQLAFEGEFYQHTLMTPFFSPGPNPHGIPPILLAAVGERMTEVAGEVADGLICHSLTTARYLREITLPALDRGRAAAGHTRPVSLDVPAFVVVGRTPEELHTAAEATRRQIAFYASTPTYRAVLDLHGWSAKHEQLAVLARQGGWEEMAAVVDDDVLAEFAAIGSPAEVAGILEERFGDLRPRLSFNTPYDVAPDLLAEIASALHADR